VVGEAVDDVRAVGGVGGGTKGELRKVHEVGFAREESAPAPAVAGEDAEGIGAGRDFSLAFVAGGENGGGRRPPAFLRVPEGIFAGVEINGDTVAVTAPLGGASSARSQ